MYCIGLADAQEAIIEVFEDKFGEDENDERCYLANSWTWNCCRGEMAEYVEVGYKTNGHKGGDARDTDATQH